MTTKPKQVRETKRKNVTQFPKPDRLKKKKANFKIETNLGGIKEGTNEIPVTKKNWKHEKMASHPHKTQTLLLRTGNKEREVLKPAWSPTEKRGGENGGLCLFFLKKIQSSVGGSWFGGDPYENCFFFSGVYFRCREKPKKLKTQSWFLWKLLYWKTKLEWWNWNVEIPNDGVLM